MNSRMLSFLPILLITLFCAVASAKSLDKSSPLYTVLQKNFPELQVDSIHTSDIPHFYTVMAGPVVFYLSDDGRYMFNGDVLDLSQGKKNITETVRNKAVLSAIERLEAGGTPVILYKAKNPKYTITVFTDITCGYCRKFHRHIPELNDAGISVRYLAFPRHGLASRSYQDVVSIWCADDPLQSLTDANNGRSIVAKTCENHSVRQQYELGLMAGITGTPSIILPDGSILPGYVEPRALLKILGALP